jgi:uncharacterized membrane protein
MTTWQRHESAAPDRSGGGTEALAQALGWFSIGLGVAELTAPRSLARFIGVRDDNETCALLRAYGAREIASGIGILSRRRPAGWVWSRVGGDAIDLATLVAAYRSDTTDTGRLNAATAAVLGVTALDIFCAQQLSGNGGAAGARDVDQPVHVAHAITVNRSIDEVFSFWRDFQNFPRFMRHVESVQVTSDRRSHWRVKGPAGRGVEWDAEIVEERDNELIVWRSIAGDVQNRGTVRFRPAPGARGTEIHVTIDYYPPFGRIGRGVAWLFGEEPDQQLRDDLRRVKQLMETGEIPLSEGPSLWRAAQPAADPQEIRKLAGVDQ